jgi:alanine racemase
VVGMMTHFATADGPELAQTERELATLHALRAALADTLPPDVLIHTHNSAATVRLSQRAGMVRVGAACYGVRTSTDFENPDALEPVMSFRSWVAQVRDVPKGRTIGYGSLFETERDSKIAALPVGFGEGYPRALFNKGIVLIHGQRCPVVGRVSLNITTVDVTDLPEAVAPGDEAVLIGRQGPARVTFEEMADKFSSVHTEINLMAGFLNPIDYV